MKKVNNNTQTLITDLKLKIIKSIKDELAARNYSVRQFAEKVDMKHPQIHRVTRGENYNIDTLIKILDGLDMEIIVQPKALK
ncbi:helix-turn-helix domain-containing protein [Paenibacillus tianjinensis]|uniref:Helix-turn-helix transcriptional regulator n=1 Tax=Paenibacillus tianjinensis TaxID=2810347 RepID=A0ABX7L5R5_9BACL|nr:helix-turn-helix transcriptional regulator [Paenibacillus tianjinensis]QSF43433.1 helix-turn-helix transcriptional regulator [Paenibacillus tianjinensis]